MMDRVSVLTSAHQTVFSLLVAVFRSLGRRTPGLTRHNALFLRLQYENLYEIHSHVQNLCEKDDLSAMDRRRMDQLMAEFGRLYLRRREGDGDRDSAPAADASDLVRPSLFYVCCPYLTEQKVALLQFRAGRSYQPSPALRKIIPISAQPVDAMTAAARRTQVSSSRGQPAGLVGPAQTEGMVIGYLLGHAKASAYRYRCRPIGCGCLFIWF